MHNGLLMEGVFNKRITNLTFEFSHGVCSIAWSKVRHWGRYTLDRLLYKLNWISPLEQAVPLQVSETSKQHTRQCLAAWIPVTMPVRQYLLQEASFKPRRPSSPHPSDLWLNFAFLSAQHRQVLLGAVSVVSHPHSLCAV